jgi:hypothetical protein
MRNILWVVRVAGLAVVLAATALPAAAARGDERGDGRTRMGAGGAVAASDVPSSIAAWRDQIRQRATSGRPDGDGTRVRQPWWATESTPEANWGWWSWWRWWRDQDDENDEGNDDEGDDDHHDDDDEEDDTSPSHPH